MASFTNLEKDFRRKWHKEIALVSRANNVDIGTATLMIFNNATFLAEAMKKQGYMPGLSIDALVKDALAVEAARQPAPAKTAAKKK